jgi:putative DNA primase/helicase
MVISNRMGFVRIDGDPSVEETESRYYFIVVLFKELLVGLDTWGVIFDLLAECAIASRGVSQRKYLTFSSVAASTGDIR